MDKKSPSAGTPKGFYAACILSNIQSNIYLFAKIASQPLRTTGGGQQQQQQHAANGEVRICIRMRFELDKKVLNENKKSPSERIPKGFFAGMYFLPNVEISIYCSAKLHRSRFGQPGTDSNSNNMQRTELS